MIKKIVIILSISIQFLLSDFTLYGQSDSSKLEADSLICVSHDTTTYLIVDKIARFQNGNIDDFRKFVAVNIKYPIEAISKGAKGTVYVNFVVAWDGNVIDVKLLRGSGFKSLDTEVLKAVKKSPKWKPAMNGNICVSQRFTFPIKFVANFGLSK